MNSIAVVVALVVMTIGSVMGNTGYYPSNLGGLWNSGVGFGSGYLNNGWGSSIGNFRRYKRAAVRYGSFNHYNGGFGNQLGGWGLNSRYGVNSNSGLGLGY